MMNRLMRFVACLFLWLPSAAAFAQADSDSRLSELERVVQQLQRRLDIIEAQIHITEPKPVVIKPGNSKDIQNWRQLRQGMTEQEVERLLGSDSKVDVNKYFFTWYYSYPSGGRVQFDPKSRSVEAWNEP